MPRLVILCGLPGSGKTTLAKKLENELPALRLTPDEWIVRLYGTAIRGEELERVRGPIESMLWDIGLRALGLGINVVQDFGVWSREERDRFRLQAMDVGAIVEIVYLEATLDVLIERLESRNAELPPGTFPITREEIEEWWQVFEPPDAEELAPPLGD